MRLTVAAMLVSACAEVPPCTGEDAVADPACTGLLDVDLDGELPEFRVSAAPIAADAVAVWKLEECSETTTGAGGSERGVWSAIDLGGALELGVLYGDLPAGASLRWEPEPLEVGETYHAVIGETERGNGPAYTAPEAWHGYFQHGSPGSFQHGWLQSCP